MSTLDYTRKYLQKFYRPLEKQHKATLTVFKDPTISDIYPIPSLPNLKPLSPVRSAHLRMRNGEISSK
uniref:Uncharacterized protein n=1 Tax=Spironucleus salmonicida TaxID=348837 RepID=V6M1N0_9EUKA|eukprot:EST47109.1 Hypothetical protein SS50377_12815 [Spironucleus salmonicida]